MNRILIIVFIIFLIAIGILLFILYRGTFPRIPDRADLPLTKINQPSNLNTYQGRIVSITPFGSDKLDIDLDVETPRILVERGSGVAKINNQGKVERLLTVEELKVGDSLEVSMEYDLGTQTYSLYVIYLK